MEEILASIRRIISEDEAPAAAPEAAAPAPEPEPEPEPAGETQSAPEPEPEPESPPAEAAAEDEEEILELTDRYEAPPSESIGDLEVSGPLDEPEPFPAAEEPAELAPMTSAEPEEPLVGETAAASAASAFAGLAASFRTPDPIPTGGTGPTIDDLARALLRPMLKEWLDAHLPGIVEAAVKKEVERISRLA